jgi:hypothetical protein
VATHLNKSELKDYYDGDLEYARQFFENFDEYERLAENRLRDDLPPEVPPVNDGTLSGLLLEIAMRQFRQMHTGKVTSNLAPDWLTALMGIYWTRWIIPNATAQSSFFNKFFNGIQGAGTYGSSWFYTFFTQRSNYSGADFSVPYIKDVILEKGKVSDRESNRISLKQYFVKDQVNRTIAMAEEEIELAKHENRLPNNPWNVELLKKLVNEFEGSDKDARDKNDVERLQSISGNYIEIIRIFQRGYGAPFYAYAPLLGDKENCVGKGTNKNPTGEMPVTGIYCLENLKNPYGKGLVEMGGHVQNILDSLVQDHVLATSLGIRPPIDVHGDASNVNLDSLRWGADEIWESKNAEIKPVKPDNSVYSQFPTSYGLYKTLLMNLLGISDMSVSAESGNPQYSKTPQGVSAQQERTTIHDNFRSQNTGNAFSRLASNLINTTIANAQGSKVVELLDDEIERLNRAGFRDEDGGELDRADVAIVWNNARGDTEDPYVYDFEVDPNSSQSDDTTAKEEVISATIKEYIETPVLGQLLAESGYKLNIGELEKQRLVNKLPDWEKVIVPIGEAGEGVAAVTDQPDEAAQIEEIMEQYSIDEKAAAIFANLRSQGMSDEQIITYVQQGAPA